MKKFFFSLMTIFFLMIFPPIGIFCMFKLTDWHEGVKKALAVISGAIFIIAIFMSV